MKHSTITIISGIYRGKKVPFDNKKFNDADITPQKIKGAVFSSIGEDLSGASFLDLYGCSGQMGFEALSRGAGPVFINELDRYRYRFIVKFSDEFNVGDRLKIYNFKDMDVIPRLRNEGLVFDFIYVDPPYNKGAGDVLLYTDLLHAIDGNGTLARTGNIIVQHFAAHSMPEQCGGFILDKTRKYGTTSISIYSFNDV